MMYDWTGQPDYEGMILARQELREISENCSGYCEDCYFRDECEEYLAFMDEAGQAFDQLAETVIMDLFSDPAECDRVRNEVFKMEGVEE